jgi:hypothetical protein
LSSEGDVLPSETRLRRLAMVPAYPSEFARPEEACEGCTQRCPEVERFEGSISGDNVEDSAEDWGGDGETFPLRSNAVGPKDSP